MKENTRIQIKQLWKDFGETPLDSLVPDVPIAETDTHKVILNSKGEIEIVSVMGEIKNIGKMKKKGAIL